MKASLNQNCVFFLDFSLIFLPSGLMGGASKPLTPAEGFTNPCKTSFGIGLIVCNDYSV